NDLGVFWSRFFQSRDVPLGNDENVRRRLRIDVLKDEYFVVFIHLLRRDFPCDDFAEQAVVHESPPYRCSFLRASKYARMSGLRSPSSTRSTSPISSRVRRSFTMRYGCKTYERIWEPKLMSSLESSICLVSSFFFSNSCS